MADQITNIPNKIKQFWRAQPSRQKKLYIGIGAVIVLGSLLFAFLLSSQDKEFVTLYTGLEPGESTEIYKVLQEMPIDVTLNSAGDILVLPEQKDRLLLELSGLGYPKSTPSYEIFSSNSSFTTTEFEKKQFLLFQLQDRIEKTLVNIDVIQSAIVTLDVPQESNYVWEDDENRTASASVLLNMKKDKTLSSAKITAIKNLIASSVPKMSPTNVTIVDAGTSLELGTEEEESLQSGYDLNRLDFEEMVEKKLADKVYNILSIGYKPNEMRVSATVVIDYKKMITEQMDYIPGEDNQGTPVHRAEAYAMNPGDIQAQGIAGEENNTDIPIYVDANNDGTPEYVYHTRNLDYFVSYMKQQIEKDKAELTTASLAITVNDTGFTDEKRANIVDLAAKATNILPENITVASLAVQKEIVIEPVPDTQPRDEQKPWWQNQTILIVIGASLLLLVAIIVFVVIMLRRKRQAALLAAEEEARLASDQALLDIQRQTEEEKRKIRDMTAARNEQDSIITDGVKEFANLHPEITAALLRSWLKEDE